MIAIIVLRLRIENNNNQVRGKKRTIETVERYVHPHYGATRRPSGEYELKIPYHTDPELDKIMDDLLHVIAVEADLKNCFSESEAHFEGTDRQW
jgi:hypothetical protein